MKYFFLVSNINEKVAGIESAVIKRVKLFREMGKKAVIGTITQNLRLSQIAAQHGLADAEILNLYNYYQNLSTTLKPMTLKVFKAMYPNWELKPIANTNDFYVHNEYGEYCMYVSCHGNDCIHYINYFDQNRRKIKRLLFDLHGNKYKEVILNEQRIVTIERLYDRNEQVCIELFYQKNEKGMNTITSIHLNCLDRDYIFQSLDGFIAHWLDDLAREQSCVFLVDRNRFYVDPILKMKESIPIFSVIHSTHVKLRQNIENGKLKTAYENTLMNLASYKGIIVSTDMQKRDLQMRVPANYPIEVIPVGYTQERAKVPMQARTPNKIVIPARFSPEKRLEHILEAVAIANRAVNNVHLHFYGFNTSNENVLGNLKSIAEKGGLSSQVYFHPFTLSILDELDDASAFLLTSKEEGFCLSLLESLSCGVPAFSYDIRYGPQDMIEHGVNGYLVNEEEVEELGSLLTHYLTNEQLKQSMSEHAYEKAKQFHADRLKIRWLQFIADYIEGAGDFNDGPWT